MTTKRAIERKTKDLRATLREQGKAIESLHGYRTLKEQHALVERTAGELDAMLQTAMKEGALR